MIEVKRYRDKRTRGQSMVEFALVFPVLLAIIFGIVEFGRFLFFYSAVTTASREAARYGAAVGDNGSGTPKYKDCTGIANAAIRLGSIAGLNSSNVTITYDTGPGTSVVATCPTPPTKVSNQNRVIVTVSVNYQTLTSLIFYNIPTVPVSATSRRSIIKSATIIQAPTAAPGPNTDPIVNVTEPVTLIFTQGDTITFTAVASDNEDGPIVGEMDWESDLDGSLATDSDTFVTSTLSVGIHLITASVTDAGGAPGSDSIIIEITAPVDAIPVVNITAPPTGTNYTEGDSVTFTATATDNEDGDLSASVTWFSSRDGSLGTASSFTTTSLSPGSHTITATVTDSASQSDTDVIIISVTGLTNTPPEITITAPSNGAVYYSATLIGISGSVDDPDESGLAANIVWTSSINGALGTGAAITYTLSDGTHTITATVTDSSGASDVKSITVYILDNADPPTDDGATYVASENQCNVQTWDIGANANWATDPGMNPTSYSVSLVTTDHNPDQTGTIAYTGDPSTWNFTDFNLGNNKQLVLSVSASFPTSPTTIWSSWLTATYTCNNGVLSK